MFLYMIHYKAEHLKQWWQVFPSRISITVSFTESEIKSECALCSFCFPD